MKKILAILMLVLLLSCAIPSAMAETNAAAGETTAVSAAPDAAATTALEGVADEISQGSEAVEEQVETVVEEAEESALITTVTDVNNTVNGLVWGVFGLVLLVGTGILMTCLTKFFQVSHFKHWIKKTIGSIFHKSIFHHSKEKGSISQFQALCTALAATVGVGNIAGVAAGIINGGPGAIFWMWIAAFFGMMTNYSENVLGIFYRRRNAKGEWAGGAMYYLQDGLGGKKGFKTIGKILAVLFSIFCVLASFGIGNASQVGNIASNMTSAFSIPAWVTGVVLLALVGLVVVGGIKRIASVTEKIVPFMVVAYLLGALVIIGTNFANIGTAFASIFKQAFGIKAVTGGIVGISVKAVVTWGFKRGVFSNEAGLGSSVMVHSASNVKEPVRQGMWGIFEVFADTIIICTITALVILTSGLVDLNTGAVAASLNKDVLVSEAFRVHFGAAGSGFIALAILFFAFSTVLGWSYYGTKAWEYLFGTKATLIYKVVFVLFIFVGATMSLSLAWDISDTFNGLMMLPNLVGVLVLSGTVMKITKNYCDRKFHHLDCEPMLSAFPELQREQAVALKKEEEE